MALAVNDVHLAIVVHVVADDGEAGIFEIPVFVELPLVLVGVDLLEPAERREDIGLAVAIDVGDADAVAVLGAAAHVMDFGLGAGEVDPQHAFVSVVAKDEVGLAVAVDVGHPAALGFAAVGDEVPLPLGAQLAGVLPPEDAVGHPADGHHVGQSVVVHVDGPLAAVGGELAERLLLAILVARPLAAGRAGILIPVGAAQQVRAAVAVHVEHGNAFGVVGAEAMHREGGLLHAARRGAARELAVIGWAHLCKSAGKTENCAGK